MESSKSQPFKLRTVVVGPFECNCRLLVCPISGDAALIDPGDAAEKILKAVKDVGPINIKYLFHTHAHLDHIGATREVKEAKTESKLVLHKDDLDMYQALPMQGQMFGIQYRPPLSIDLFCEDEQTYEFGKLRLRVIHTPGHSPGGVCFELSSSEILNFEPILFSGDTLFHESIGRTDLWGGDLGILKKSIKQRLFKMDDQLRVCPGHGEDTSIYHEKKHNPFVS